MWSCQLEWNCLLHDYYAQWNYYSIAAQGHVCWQANEMMDPSWGLPVIDGRRDREPIHTPDVAPMQGCELPTPAQPMDPPQWVAVWNLQQETTESGLCAQLDSIDWMPETFVKVEGMDGAFLLQYKVYPWLASTLSMALNDTCGYLEDNGNNIRVLHEDDEKPADIPIQIWDAFQRLHSIEKWLAVPVEKSNTIDNFKEFHQQLQERVQEEGFARPKYVPCLPRCPVRPQSS